MPIYEYRCDQGHSFEILQRMADDPLTSCTTCEARVERVMHPVAVHFKGSGFYTTDYARKGRSDGDSDANAKKNGSKDGGSSSKDGDSKGGKAEASSGSASSGSKPSGSD
jgi:putative FmdB family regulatory protein